MEGRMMSKRGSKAVLGYVAVSMCATAGCVWGDRLVDESYRGEPIATVRGTVNAAPGTASDPISLGILWEAREDIPLGEPAYPSCYNGAPAIEDITRLRTSWQYIVEPVMYSGDGAFQY